MTGSPLTPEQRTFVPDEGLAGRMTAPIETTLQDIDSDHDPEQSLLPFLAAQAVVIEDQPEAFGRRTEVWLHMGSITGGLDVVKARRTLAEMRAFLPKLEAVIALAEEQAAGDYAGDPELAAIYREAEDRRIKAISAGAQA